MKETAAAIVFVWTGLASGMPLNKDAGVVAPGGDLDVAR
jgi:hypothetical protein